jgi:hypothetical protein
MRSTTSRPTTRTGYSPAIPKSSVAESFSARPGWPSPPAHRTGPQRPSQQTPGTYPPAIPIDDPDGDFVLDIGYGVYVNYAHMQTGSVRPKGWRAGQDRRRDRAGRQLRQFRCTPSTFVCHGFALPVGGTRFALPDRFSVTDQVASTADFDAAEATSVPLFAVPDVTVTEHTDQLILDQNIVTFTPLRSVRLRDCPAVPLLLITVAG